jgi:hypothetical protein
MRKESVVSTHDLRPSERRFVAAMQQLGYGWFESLRIQGGEIVLDPWPTTVRSVKFGNTTPNRPSRKADFGLKGQITELLAHVRRIDAGLIRLLEIRGGLPFCMELVDQPDAGGSCTS